MNIIKTAIEGLVIIEPRLFQDDRGYFLNLSIKKSLKRKYVKLLLFRIMNLNQLMVLFVVFISKSHLLLRVN